MCLPHCPTYRATQSEAESPRGRISLLLALARGDLAPEGALIAHIDNCLACRACEANCPSEVPYGELIVAGRALLREAGHGPARSRAAALLADHGIAGRTLRGLARGYRASGLKPVADRLLGNSRLGRLNRMLPDTGRSERLPAFTPALGQEQGRVVLFTGCTGRLFEPATVGAAIRLLSHAGYGVHLPAETLCCGAMDLHAGDTEAARTKIARTVTQLADYGADAVIGIASSCAGTLTEWERWLGPDAPATTVPVHEITAFLAEAAGLEGLHARAAEAPVAVHEPCSLRNVLKGGGAAARLLGRLGIDSFPLPGNDQCCGAAGEYMLTHPEKAEALRQPKLEALRASGARYLVSANIGCALHLAAGARASGLAVEVLHPVVLAERLLRD